MHAKKKVNFNSEIREGTFVKIEKELEFLKKFKLLNYTYIKIGNFKHESVFRISIDIDNKLFGLVNTFKAK